MEKLHRHKIDFSIGLNSINRKIEAQTQFALNENLQPVEFNEQPMLNSLFFFPTFEDYITDRLNPSPADPSMFFTSNFLQIIFDIKNEFRNLSKIDPDSARDFGKLVRFLDEKGQLVELLKMYRSALVQG